MAEISVDKMNTVIMEEEGALSQNQAARFLSALSATLDRAIAQRADNPAEVMVTFLSDQPVLTLGLIPKEDLIDATSASTGLPPVVVSKYIDLLDKILFRPQVTPDTVASEPVTVEGFGTFDCQAGRVMFKPTAFQYARSESS